MITKLVIYGAGGLAKEIFDTIHQINAVKKSYEIICFIDDHNKVESFCGLMLVNARSFLSQGYDNVKFVNAGGFPKTRKQIYSNVSRDNMWETIIHPSAVISGSSKILAGCVLQAFTLLAADSYLGKCCLVNAKSSLGHDSKVDDFTCLSAFCDITGEASLGRSVFAGTGCKILPNVKIGPDSFLCAGSVVCKDVPAKCKVMGNPGKIIDYYE